MKQLTQKEVEKNLARMSAWMTNKSSTVIEKAFNTNSFLDGLALIAKLAVHAELMNHHPAIELTYTNVIVRLTTHDVAGLTKLDFELAKRIDAIRA